MRKPHFGDSVQSTGLEPAPWRCEMFKRMVLTVMLILAVVLPAVYSGILPLDALVPDGTVFLMQDGVIELTGLGEYRVKVWCVRGMRGNPDQMVTTMGIVYDGYPIEVTTSDPLAVVTPGNPATIKSPPYLKFNVTIEVKDGVLTKTLDIPYYGTGCQWQFFIRRSILGF